ncbi:MAG TPA: pyridoxal 5'-phosphate synthase [Acidothermaceae bacterium]|jgi:pyridoxamine 5'-phosphate oxidase|nr:pyridoxal 5'-phosphate synthase [Acidothermaceae bacterium]
MNDIRQYLRDLPVFAGDLPGFEPGNTPADPVSCFHGWLVGAVAAGVREPHAMTLSTLGEDGIPSARVLLLKNVDEAGWQFAVHAASPKGRELTANAVAALTFYWPEQARQVRVRGTVRAESAESSAADFLARSDGSRASAMSGLQSTPLDDLGSVDVSVKQALERLAQEPGLVVSEWSLCTLAPERVEFWQGDKDRKHTRVLYQRDGDAWTKQLLWP